MLARPTPRFRSRGSILLLASLALGCAVDAAPPGAGPPDAASKAAPRAAVQMMALGEVPQFIDDGLAEAPQLARGRRPRTELPEPMPALSSTAAELGQLAPDFALPDQAGRTVRLSDYRGKVVVLEWFDPECPHVKHCHESGSLKELGNAAVRDGVVWLAVNSVRPDRGGASLARNQAAREEWTMRYPVLFDASGDVARDWRVATTPQLFVVDAGGVLVYQGAIDNAQEPGHGPPVDYVQLALSELRAGQLTRPKTTPYGCGID
jgi:peroxiredoxin